MESTFLSSANPNPAAGAGETSRRPAPAHFWLNGLVRCNPFYLLSALLLIYGIYRASVDPHFFATETQQVVFNFFSLEVYGLLLVGTSWVLARRRIWYDSTMLVMLENLLVLIPFMLVSHAVFLGKGLAWSLCLGGSVLVAAKFAGFKRGIPDLNMPAGLLGAGMLVLVVNLAMPLLFRKGLDTGNEIWTVRSGYCWDILLPLLVLLGNALPKPDLSGKVQLPHQQQWLPDVMFLLWITGTAIHLYTIGYVDDQRFDPGKFSVIAWSFSWLVCARLPLFLPSNSRFEKPVVFALPILVTLLATLTGRASIFIGLNLTNAFIFGIVSLNHATPVWFIKMSGASLIAAFLGIPEEGLAAVANGHSKSEIIFILIAVVGVAQAFWSIEPKRAVLGAICLFALLMGTLHEFRNAVHIAFQVSCAFFLVHSLWWPKPAERGTGTALLLIGSAWLLDSMYLQSAARYPDWRLPIITGSATLILSGMVKYFFGRRDWIPLVVSGCVILTPPAWFLAEWVKQAPASIIALLASLLLFVAGTVYAFWKTRFHRTES